MSAKLAFTCGDPAGVGPEIIAAWLAAHRDEAGDVAIIGPARWLRSLPQTKAQLVAVGAVGAEDFAAVAGRPSVEGARVALAALERAAAGARDGEFSGVVTGPVSKAWLQKAGYEFPGQTEFFAARWGGEPTMAFCGGRLRVVLLTWHIPLREVPSHLTPAELARAVRAAAELARADGIAAPRIGVCGLNPHAGEGGMLGTEERDVIDPFLDSLRAAAGAAAGAGAKENAIAGVAAGAGAGANATAGASASASADANALAGAGISRCEPGDTIFGRALRGEFDVVVALYHDQGLAPLKTIDFDEAVNVTLGLAHVRTSPDHGTAFGIAGKGVASPRSFANAVAVARRLVALRARGGVARQ